MTLGDTDRAMEEESMSALIAGRPGPLRDALRALLMVMPQIGTVNQADDTSSALRAIAEYDPALVLLDVNLPGNGNGTWAVVRRIKASGAQSRCLILVDDLEQQRKAQTAGADVALLKGFPAAKLLEIIESLLKPAQEVA